jgi:GDP-L-fucose synthase
MKLDSRVFVAGHRGLVGSAVCRKLEKEGYTNLLLRTRAELDLQHSDSVDRFFAHESPEYVILAAAKVGGILANKQFPVPFITENLAIQSNVIRASFEAGVKRLLFLGSSCIYPRDCPQPIREEYLLSGPLEPTNRPYALAKIAGIETCWAYNRQYGTRYLAAMPTNLYGPGDDYDLTSSHVIPALIRKISEAKKNGEKSICVWGTGTPRREFLYSDDFADACVFLMNLEDSQFDDYFNKEKPPLVNVGKGEDMTIAEIARNICSILGYDGDIVYDLSKPDGTPRKLLDSSLMLSLGWQARTEFSSGIQLAYEAVSDWENGY